MFPTAPHLGGAYSTMSVDVMARYQVGAITLQTSLQRHDCCVSSQIRAELEDDDMGQGSACFSRRVHVTNLSVLLQRLRGREVTMITGTDEHGEKIALSAAKAGLDPKTHCDAVVQEYKHLWQLVRLLHMQLPCCAKRVYMPCCSVWQPSLQKKWVH
jgi:tRNA synthetases class I (M)